jgi:hypothetical protein
MECDHVTGECIQNCPAGTMGRNCNQRKIFNVSIYPKHVNSSTAHFTHLLGNERKF